ncbi:MAG: response regulator [Pseudomonadota bacterium]
MKTHQQILLVEDDPLIALDMELQFQEADCEVVGKAFSCEKAVSLLEIVRPDFAVLDYNLKDGTSKPVARKLKELDIPFCFVTARGAAALRADNAPEAPVLSKPFDMRAVARLMKEAA